MELLNSPLGTSFSPIDTVLDTVLTSLWKLLPDYEAISCDWAALDFRSNLNFSTSTVSFNNEDNCCQSQEFEKLFKDNAFKSYFKHSILASLPQVTANNQCLCQSDFFFFSQNHARNLGVGLLFKCGLYMSFYGNPNRNSHRLVSDCVIQLL